MRLAMFASALACAAISGCAQPEVGTRTVGTEGGTIESTDGVTITIPPGALTGDTTIRITPSDDAPPNAIGPAFLFEPEGIQFAVPVKVTLPFDPSKMPKDMNGVSVLTAPGGSDRYTSLGGSLEDATHVTTTTTHFSIYAAGAGSTFTIASGLNYPAGLAVASGTAYWASGGTVSSGLPTRGVGVVQKAATTGGPVKTLTDPEDDPRSLGVLGSTVFWVNGGKSSTTGDTGSALLRVSTHGGAAQTVAGGLLFAVDVAVDNAGVVFVDADAGLVGSVPVAGGAVTSLATGQSEPFGVAIDANDAYFTCRGDGTVRKVPRAGGAATVLATGQSDPRGLAVDGKNVYWVDAGDGRVLAAPIGGGSPVVLAEGQAKPLDVATDGKNVYWTSSAGETVHKVSVAGGAITTIASHQHVPLSIALDSSNVYWVENGSLDYDGAIDSAPK
jgi:hypothetical protein